MFDICLIDTGGTFHKHYDAINGSLQIAQTPYGVLKILEHWHVKPNNITRLVGKDSLQMTTADRIEILAYISKIETQRILIIHGTDTMDITAAYLFDAELEKSIVLTGAMRPFEIDPIEATANFASAWGYLQHPSVAQGVHIAMHGMVLPFHRIKKEKNKGRFVAMS